MLELAFRRLRDIRARAKYAATQAHGPAAIGGSNWAVLLLFLTMAINYADRGVLNILVEPLKRELSLSDGQIGALGGLSFALLHISVAFPIAWLADRFNRVYIIVGSLLMWSGLTSLCGAAQSFTQLVLLRIGIGMGEAGASPPAHSMISDYFTPERRSSSLSVINLGVPLGTMLGVILGGAIAHLWGWRVAFVLVGMPGVPLALVMWRTLKEPQRGRHDSAGAAQQEAPPLLEAASTLLRIRTFVILAIGGSLANLANQGVIQFNAAFYMRRFSLNILEVGLLMGIAAALASAAGMILGGILSDRAARHDVRWYAWIPASGMFIAGPTIALAFAQSRWAWALLFQCVAGLCSVLYVGPVLGMNQNLAPLRMRATSVALFNLVNSGIGYGLGPIMVGLFGDRAARITFSASGFGNFKAMCPGGIGSSHAAMAVKQACLAASAAGLQQALRMTAVVYMVAGTIFLLAALAVRRDLQRSRERPLPIGVPVGPPP